MSAGMVGVVTIATAVGAGLMAGFFFAFSACVMKALARLPSSQGITAMQSINVTVLNRLFFKMFFGTAVGCILLLLIPVPGQHRFHSVFVVVGSLCYLIGVIVVTIVCNVPRNERLATTDPTSTQSVRLWDAYLVEWTRWNHVRTAASLAAALAMLLALRWSVVS